MVVILITMKRFTILLALSLLLLLSGCGSYRVATFPLAFVGDANTKELCSVHLQADAEPILYRHEMPETEENEGRMISFTDMVEPNELQTAINLAAKKQGSNCIGLKDVEITYRWMSLPGLGGYYVYRIKGFPVRKK